MTRITIQGLGLVGAFGAGVDALVQALEGGATPRSFLEVPTATGPVALPAYRADCSPLKALASPKLLRRMDRFTRLGLLAARLALADAGMEPGGHAGLGLVLASGYGATSSGYALLESMIQDGDPCTSPTAFAQSLHNACSGSIAIALGATGPSLTVSQFDLSVPCALLTARQWLLDGRVERVLFGALDELSDLSGYLWLQQHGVPGPEPMAPLRTRAATAVPGEGAAFMVLSRVAETRPGYCTLDQVELGRRPDGARILPPGSPDLRVLNADGRLASGARYRAEAGARLACYTPLYGSMPASPAFDLAVGALMLRQGSLYPSPQAACDFPAEVALGGSGNASGITCLTLDEHSGYGLVEIGPIGSIITG